MFQSGPNQQEKPIHVAKYDRGESPLSSPEGSEYAGTPSPVDSDIDMER